MPDDSRADPHDTILVVDDDALMRRTVASNLEDAGFRAVTVEGGREAVDYFARGGTAAAMLLDWQMPEVDGPECLRRLRAAGQAVPVIFLTGLSQPIFEEKGLELGAVDYVDKAKSFAIILQRLRLVLAGAKEPAGERGPAGTAVAALQLDGASARALWRGRRVDLTLSEFKVVQLMAARAGRDVGYREIYDLVRGEGFQAGSGEDGFRANVRAMVKRIRQKFRAIDAEFDALKNYPGFGYRWEG